MLGNWKLLYMYLSYLKHESYQISAAFLFDEFGKRNSCAQHFPDSEARTTLVEEQNEKIFEVFCGVGFINSPLIVRVKSREEKLIHLTFIISQQ